MFTLQDMENATAFRRPEILEPPKQGGESSNTVMSYLRRPDNFFRASSCIFIFHIVGWLLKCS